MISFDDLTLLSILLQQDLDLDRKKVIEYKVSEVVIGDRCNKQATKFVRTYLIMFLFLNYGNFEVAGKLRSRAARMNEVGPYYCIRLMCFGGKAFTF